MRQAAADLEQVPDAVPEPEAAVEGVEHDADGVEPPAGEQSDKAGRFEVVEQRLDGDDYDPANDGVDHQRYDSRVGAQLDLLQHPDFASPFCHRLRFILRRTSAPIFATQMLRKSRRFDVRD